uniref:ER membrane protein complex subunit 3 n=1 Tax=Tetradesmus obliquus TaxID=3088 RepID=A0A383VG52_TETOB|eukprot:jgi/Sobl393_1/3566/SZX63769.1
MGYHELVLDSNVRDWVFIPLTLFIVLMKLLMQYAHQMTSAAPVTTKVLAEIQEQQGVTRSQRIRAAANWLPESAFRMRKEFFTEKESGVFNKEPCTRPMHETMATDPSFMVDMMKKNLTGMLPQIVMGAAVSFFFSGFVMGKVPFGLSPRFRPMLQRGVDLSSLDVSYFTSLSYYFALLFASRGPFSLVFRENTLDETEMMKRQMNPMAGGAGFDAKAAFKTELQGWGAGEHEWTLLGAEDAALAVLKANAQRS